MNEELRIRPYNIEDKGKLIEILTLNVPEYFAESEIEDLDNYLDDEIEQYFVAEINEEIIGAGGINFDSDYKIGIISWDFINPKFQGIGLGTNLLRYRIELLKSMKSIEIISVRTSQLAYKFYEKNGFVLKEIKKDYWAKGFDMYKMVYQ
ncbi:MAG: GNAT family N-acetyltransferase [Ginsengibacter sp.]